MSDLIEARNAMETGAAKKIGFNADAVRVYKKERTAQEWMNDELFVNACEKYAEKMGGTLDELITRRQAAKFKSGKGVVYNNVIKR